jgi:hypothetical protein
VTRTLSSAKLISGDVSAGACVQECGEGEAMRYFVAFDHFPIVQCSVPSISHFWFDDRLSNKSAISNASRSDCVVISFSLPTNGRLAEQMVMFSGASEKIRKDPLWTLEDDDEDLNAKAQEVANAWKDQPSTTFKDALEQTRRIATK